MYIDYGTGEEELYDLARDTHEMTNRVDDPAYLDIRRVLRSPRPSLPHRISRRRAPDHPTPNSARAAPSASRAWTSGGPSGSSMSSAIRTAPTTGGE